MANDDSTRTGYDLSPWESKDPLTLGEAACLWAGYPPGLRKVNLSEPARFAVKQEWERQIKQAAEAGRIDYERPEVNRTKIVAAHDDLGRISLSDWERRDWGGYPSVQATERGPVAWTDASFTRAALRGYAVSIGQRPAFLFPEAVEVSALRCLDRDRAGSHFSEELEAAILAWHYASERAEGSKQKPRALIVEWLQKNRPQWKEGENVFERVATLANWEKKTGPKALK